MLVAHSAPHLGQLPAGHAGTRMLIEAGHSRRPMFSDLPAVRNVVLLQSPLTVFLLSKAFLSLVDVVTDAVEVRAGVQAEHLWLRRKRDAHALIEAIPAAMMHLKYVGTP